MPIATSAARPLRVTFGQGCRDTRLGLDLTQQQLADRVGVTRGYIAKVERGRANPSLELVGRIGEALGLRLSLTMEGPIFLGDRRQRDAVHARCSGYVDRRLRGAGLQTAREVEIIRGRAHGWIDILAFDPKSRTLFIIEIKTRLDDLGAVERQIAWYERSAGQAASRLGWRPLRVVTWLLVLASDEVDAFLRANRTALASAFPRRAREMMNAFADACDLHSGDRGLAMIDPSSRRETWLIRSRVDGRRSPARYRDYADAVRVSRRVMDRSHQRS
jgi:transcriptional regulator with XRE-family HTH domain